MNKTPKTSTKRFGLGLLSLFAALATHAGTATYDFNSAPPADLNFVGNAEWRQTGGVNNSGYMALFDSINSQYAAVLIPDFDSGLVVKSFTFECDLRVGNAVGNGGRPADGFSISYAHADDPVVLDLKQEPPVVDWSEYAVSGAPENGTKTGLAVSFDTWSGNALPDGADIEGLILRVDNVTKQRIGMATRNGACNDATSLQTGPWDGLDTGSPDGLCWAPLKVVLDDAGKLTVTWKGTVVANAVDTGFAPSAGRMVFAGRTGGANENTHIDNLKITTVPATTMLIGNVAPSPFGFTVTISDSGQSILNPATLVLTYDGAVVTPTTVTKPVGSTVTTIQYLDMANRLASGSAHSLVVTANDTQGTTVTRTQNYTIPAYTLVPASYKLAATPTVPGFKTTTHWVDETITTPAFERFPGDANWVRNAEQQIAGGYIDSTTGQPYPNAAAPAANTVASYVNWDQNATDPGGDNFNSTTPAATPIANDVIPGIPVGDYNDFVVETIAYVQLKRGVVRMGVNSDDGFRVTVAPGQPSVAGVELGRYDGGRGASDTIFEFVVDEDGYYPMRLLYWEGGGGANCEWFTVDSVTGEKILVNDSTKTASLKAFQNGAGRAAVKSVLPAEGWGLSHRAAGITATLVDGTTTATVNKLIVGGVDVTSKAQINKNGATTTVRFAPTSAISEMWNNATWSLVWTENTTPATVWTNNFSYRYSIGDVPTTGAFSIEAEHFDTGGGQAAPGITGTGYEGGEYSGLSAVHNVDYYQDGNEPSQDGAYRSAIASGLSPNVPMDAQTVGNDLDTERPGFVVTTNFKIGWAGNGEWYSYTRTIPAGIYTAFSAHSVDPAGNVGGDLGLVTAGAGTTSQTVQTLGRFTGPAPGGWGNNGIIPLRATDGSQAAFKLPGGKVTLRYTTQGGDFDWFVLVPTVAPAKMVSKPNTTFSVPQTLVWRFTDLSTTINTSSAVLKVDGATVPASGYTVAKSGDITTVSYVTDRGKVHTFELSISDSGGAVLTDSGTFIANFMTPSPTGMFLIEAEDFNTGNGLVEPEADQMPYLGDAYKGLGGTPDIDYARGGNEQSNNGLYRLAGMNPGVPMSTDGDRVRARDAAGAATWTLTANYRLGWAGGGNWGNYTRAIPAGTYQVWASMSHGDPVSSATVMQGNLTRVTSDPKLANQVTEPVGYFRAPATGGWGANQLVPMRIDSSTQTGDAAVVSLGGASPTTLRFEFANGDFDYMMLVPAAATQKPTLNPPQRQPNGDLIISWSPAGGVLEATPTLDPATRNWQPVPGATTPFTWTPGTTKEVYVRVRQ